ncbi:MAG: radical SAM family heme chaperone HemW [Bacteroidetes bacterium]|nr:radical SAM family heme chaperone HemW [Bacteroidota bacterium]
MAGIYIHIPFCRQACHYCNFYFTTSPARREQLVGAIIHEAELTRDYLCGEVIETIYLGGGTPTMLEKGQIQQILEGIYKWYPDVNLKELTIEANPDDLTDEKVAELTSLRALGLNRLSIGVQSFHEVDLIYMNRAHNATEALDAIERVQAAGFSNLTIDLIYGTPSMSDEAWRLNIRKAFELGIPHISSYALTVEPKTYLDKNIRTGRVLPVDDAQSSRQFDILMEEMAAHGYDQYEISNFALPGHRAVHNTNYWRGTKYLGLGPSAHSYDGSSRRWNVANNDAYIRTIISDGEVPYETEILTPAQRANEYIMTSLRTMWGCDLTNEQIINYNDQIRQSLANMDHGHYILQDKVIKLTQAGKHYADRIASELFVDEP